MAATGTARRSASGAPKEAEVEFDEESARVWVTVSGYRNPIETMVVTDKTIELALVEFGHPNPLQTPPPGSPRTLVSCLRGDHCLPSGNYSIWLGDLIGFTRSSSGAHEFSTCVAEKRARLTDRDGDLLSDTLISRRGGSVSIRWRFDSSEVAEEFFRALQIGLFELRDAFRDEVPELTMPWPPRCIPFRPLPTPEGRGALHRLDDN